MIVMNMPVRHVNKLSEVFEERFLRRILLIRTFIIHPIGLEHFGAFNGFLILLVILLILGEKIE